MLASKFSLVRNTIDSTSQSPEKIAKTASVCQSTFSMLGNSMFNNMYSVQQAMVPIKAYVSLPKPWFRITNMIGAGVDVYEGMIVGLNSRSEDLAINVCKEKHLTNTRASGSDEALRLVPPIQMSLEKAIEFIQDDELVEITPKSIRLRKKILDNKERERAARNANK